MVSFEIMTIFQDETQNLAKSMHFCIYSDLIVKKIWHIGTTINTINKKSQNISFENSFLWKHDFLAKGPWKGQ